MLSVDSTIKISAMELSVADPTTDLPPFVAPPASGGVNAQVNVVATHFYPTCNQRDVDTTLFDRVPQMVQYINYVYQELGTRADLKNVPIWVTENNVNADYDNGKWNEAIVFRRRSSCWIHAVPARFLRRGGPTFFTTWESRQSGAVPLGLWRGSAVWRGGLRHREHVSELLGGLLVGADVSFDAGFSWAKHFAINRDGDVEREILGTKNGDGSVIVMVVDRAVHASTDNNGTGDPRTAIVDVSALGTFSGMTSITIDAKTNATSGPASLNITPAQKISVTLGGYGVTFLKLKP